MEGDNSWIIADSIQGLFRGLCLGITPVGAMMTVFSTEIEIQWTILRQGSYLQYYLTGLRKYIFINQV